MSLEQMQSYTAPVKLLAKLIEKINRFFDWIYHSNYNPLYRSGTLIVGLFSILLVTGLYLILFYDVGDPYRSVADIEKNVPLGSWVRALHRYATDAAMVALVYHVLQLAAQGRTWGPRTLAWISGVVLLAGMLLSAWSGYVMIWDQHGQLLVLAGAEMLQVFPFMRSAIGQAFDGTTELRGSFFFMNLFLHVAIPLGMVAGIWIHTARLNRTVWFPKKEIFIGCCLALGIIALIIPAPLLEQANLLQEIGRIPTDWFYGFWLPIWIQGSPAAALIFWVLFFLVLLVIPWIVIPKKRELFASSYVDQENCAGCRQCSRDCPYESVIMKPRTGPIPVYASVNPALCVSCGLCMASCDDMAIGPPLRKASEQQELFESSLNSTGDVENEIALLACSNNSDSISRLTGICDELKADLISIECCGVVHAENLELLLKKRKGVLVWGCPERNCKNRDGILLFKQRVYEFRHPTLSRKTNRQRVRLVNVAAWEEKEFREQSQDFVKLLDSLDGSETISEQKIASRPRAFRIGRTIVASLLFTYLIALLSALPMGTEPEEGFLKLALRLPGISRQQCRPITAEESSSLPKHMQKQEICEEGSVSYRLTLNLNGTERIKQAIARSGLRGDRPVSIERKIPLDIGTHQMKLLLVPLDPELAESMTLELEQELVIQSVGQIQVISYNKDRNSLELIR
jgi:ferredoxin/coenzyme F420-reducing hydrogenase delta subunit